MRIDKTMNSVKVIFLKLVPYSYTIYLFHTTAEGFAKSIFFKIPIENYLTPDLYFIFSAFLIISLGVFAPIIIHKIAVSKGRSFNVLFGMKYIPKK
jgi:hypothetical protein